MVMLQTEALTKSTVPFTNTIPSKSALHVYCPGGPENVYCRCRLALGLARVLNNPGKTRAAFLGVKSVFSMPPVRLLASILVPFTKPLLVVCAEMVVCKIVQCTHCVFFISKRTTCRPLPQQGVTSQDQQSL